MERLTTREEYPHGAEGVSKDRLTGKYCRGTFEATACVERLAEYENAEADGRLLELPCRVGDTVFVDLNTLPFTDMEYSEEEQAEIPKFLPARVVSYRKNARTTFVKIAVRANWLDEWIDQETGPESAYYEKERYFSFPISAIGKTLFLSKEVAESALKEMEGQA